VGLSRSETHKLSNRLREAEVPAPEDIALLGEVLIRFNGAPDQVATGLRSIGLSPTTRLKTSGTIIEKLKRQPHLDLTTIRDLAGARVVQRMTLNEQDGVSQKIRTLWPSAQLIDRRVSPSHGYRAVHVVPKIDGCAVEIQLRTLYQDTWAQVMETLGDVWGRAIRYGGAPSDPDVEFFSGTTRGKFVETWIRQADEFHRLALLENELAALEAVSSPSEQQTARAAEVRKMVDQDFSVHRDAIRSLAPLFASPRGG
jgi:hypothetical protein